MTASDLYGPVRSDRGALPERPGLARRIRIGGGFENGAEMRTRPGGGLPLALAVTLGTLPTRLESFRGVGMALTGNITNDAIVMIERIDIEHANLDRDVAIVAGAAERFRPIASTSTTKVLGLPPMASDGGAFGKPLATLKMGGLRPRRSWR